MPSALQAFAMAVCTEKQIAVLELRGRHGFSLRGIALATGSSLSTVRGHLDAAHWRIDNGLREAPAQSASERQRSRLMKTTGTSRSAGTLSNSQPS
jgi:hypothetical protein